MSIKLKKMIAEELNSGHVYTGDQLRDYIMQIIDDATGEERRRCADIARRMDDGEMGMDAPEDGCGSSHGEDIAIEIEKGEL